MAKKRKPKQTATSRSGFTVTLASTFLIVLKFRKNDLVLAV
jgi:hypothetical protein